MKHFSKTSLAIILAAMSLCFSAALQAADEPELFYRGAFDSKTVEAANGAKVNAEYNKFLSEGAFGGTQVVEVRKGVWSITGYSLANYTFVEGKTGLIAFDTGSNEGMGRAALKLISEKTNKPVVAIIYSHFHYTGGAQAYAVTNPGIDMPVYGHPDLEGNLTGSNSAIKDMQNRRGGIQLGAYLPREGADATYGPAEPHFDDPELTAYGHLTVTHPVKDGEEVTIDGIKFTFYHVVADTRDSLIAYAPELDLALHNSGVTNLLFPSYTLRGDYYRAPTDVVEGVDKLRSLNARYVVGVHGMPLEGEYANTVMTAHRDAIAFTWNQSIRMINQGKTVEEMVETIRLPKHLSEIPDLYQAYVDQEYNVRGQYRGIVGWYGEEIADLHPPKEKELAQNIVDMAGGTGKVIAQSQKAIDEKKYNLAVKLLTYVLAVEPENSGAKQLKADTLRHMAYTTKTGIQTRNFLLSYALHLEGKVNVNEPPPFNIFGLDTTETIMAGVPGVSIKALEAKIDPIKSANIEKVVSITFAQSNQSWDIRVRRGVAEVSPHTSGKVNANLLVPREEWLEMVVGDTKLSELLKSDAVKVNGSKSTLKDVLGSFDNIDI
jgi:alkyl sulfatase BDS1-like metallo-beta-lactamase superfamily hydrolase